MDLKTFRWPDSNKLVFGYFALERKTCTFNTFMKTEIYNNTKMLKVVIMIEQTRA